MATARDRKAGKMVVRKNAEEHDVKIIEDPKRKVLRSTAAAYIQDAKDRKANEAQAQGKLVTDEFLDKVVPPNKVCG